MIPVIAIISILFQLIIPFYSIGFLSINLQGLRVSSTLVSLSPRKISTNRPLWVALENLGKVAQLITMNHTFKQSSTATTSTTPTPIPALSTTFQKHSWWLSSPNLSSQNQRCTKHMSPCVNGQRFFGGIEVRDQVRQIPCPRHHLSYKKLRFGT